MQGAVRTVVCEKSQSRFPVLSFSTKYASCGHSRWLVVSQFKALKRSFNVIQAARRISPLRSLLNKLSAAQFREMCLVGVLSPICKMRDIG